MGSMHRPRAWRNRIAFWAAAAATLLVAHDAVIAVQVGPGEAVARALRQGGHAWWGIASLVLGAAAIGLALAAASSILGLRRRAADLGARVTPLPRGRFASRAGLAWARLAVIVGVGFVMQENLEHALSHQHLPGLGALAGPEYPLAVPVLAAITGLAALIVAAVALTERALVQAIASALRGRGRRAPRTVGRPPRSARLPRPNPLAGAAAGRAPPPLLAPHA